MEILKVFSKDKLYFLIYTAVFLSGFSGMLYLLMKLPGIEENACSTGNAATPGNLIFVAIFIGLLGFIITSYIELIRQKASSFKPAGTGLISVIISFLASVCTVCFVPTISLLGFSIGFGLFQTYNLQFKLISIACMLVSLYFLENNLRQVCKICKT